MCLHSSICRGIRALQRKRCLSGFSALLNNSGAISSTCHCMLIFGLPICTGTISLWFLLKFIRTRCDVCSVVILRVVVSVCDPFFKGHGKIETRIQLIVFPKAQLDPPVLYSHCSKNLKLHWIKTLVTFLFCSLHVSMPWN